MLMSGHFICSSNIRHPESIHCACYAISENVRLKIVASGCDQCVWVVGVVAGHGHWVGH